MKKTIEKYFCDICGAEGAVQSVRYPVIFHTDQDEGRACKEYISYENLDLCQQCLRKGLVFHGWGAQGINRYEVKE